MLAAVGTVAFSTPAASPTTTRSPSPYPTARPPAQQPPDPALASFYDQRLEWAACGDDECATLTVPLDYDDPAGRPSASTSTGGRPTSRTTRSARCWSTPAARASPAPSSPPTRSGYFRPALLRYFDIVGFDPRGTGRSAPVDCLSDSDLDAYVAGDPEPSTPEEARAAVRLTRGLGRGCAALSGALGLPRLDRGGRPRHGRAACRPGRAGDQLLRLLLRHRARRDLRRAVPRAGRAVRARRRRRPGRRPARGRPRPGGRLRDRAAGLRRQLPRRHRLLLPRRLRRGGPAADPRPARPGRGGTPDDHAAAGR